MPAVLLVLSALLVYTVLRVAPVTMTAAHLSAHALMWMPWSMALYAVLEQRIADAQKRVVMWGVVAAGAVVLLLVLNLFLRNSYPFLATLMAQIAGVLLGLALIRWLSVRVIQKNRSQQAPWFCSASALVLLFWCLSLALPLLANWRSDVWLASWRELFNSGINLWLLPQAVMSGWVVAVIVREREQDTRPIWETMALLLGLLVLGSLIGQATQLTEWLGLMVGALLAALVPVKWRNTALFTLLFAVTLLHGLRPLMLLQQAKPFHWQPFWSLFASEPGVAVQSMADKLFWISALVWITLRQEMSTRMAVALVIVWLGLIELVQRMLVAQTAEIYEPFLAAVVALVLIQWPLYWNQFVSRTKPVARATSASANQPKSTKAAAS